MMSVAKGDKKFGDEDEEYQELEYLMGEMPRSTIDFLKAHSSNDGEHREDEIVEIDINDFSYVTLCTLRKLLDDFSQEN
ncbi:hypothetical protein VNO78_05542 [Psophocarpus tetragonolobus]|uniref:NET domain-containing protein n=1 Tax=Psophocarpus tetragonolobus TaxID=3891 RepID=A0AAN9XR65_PSOTE